MRACGDAVDDDNAVGECEAVVSNLSKTPHISVEEETNNTDVR